MNLLELSLNNYNMDLEDVSSKGYGHYTLERDTFGYNLLKRISKGNYFDRLIVHSKDSYSISIQYKNERLTRNDIVRGVQITRRLQLGTINDTGLGFNKLYELLKFYGTTKIKYSKDIILYINNIQ